MSVIIPQTDLYLLKVPIEIDNKNQLTFTNASQQYTYFNSLVKHENPEQGTFTYQRQDGTIRYPACIDDIREFNYCMYRNDGYSDKWFYAFITDMQYVSDKVTAITIKTDVWQTWQFSITFLKSFIEREHVNDDTIGKNLVPEGLETGDYIVNDVDSYVFNDLVYMFNVGKWNNGTDVVSTNVNGIPQAGGFYKLNNISQVRSVIQAYVEETGVSLEDIFNVYVVPRLVTTNSDPELNLQWSGNDNPVYTEKTLTVPSTIDTYTPVNNKVKCYPYNYLIACNTSGAIEKFNYEKFDGVPRFSIGGTASVGASIVCIPNNYEGAGDITTMLTASKFPTLSWSGDAYTNWLTQNGVNMLGTIVDPIKAGYITSGIEAGIGVASLLSGNIFGVSSVAGGVSHVMETMQSQYEHQVAPNSFYGNSNNGDFINAGKRNGFYFYNMSVDRYFAKRIDDFFTMYGYKVNTLKVPNITGRSNWNYVKTIGCNIEGYIPQSDMQEIKDMFNNGVTLWHKANKFLDYSESNTII